MHLTKEVYAFMRTQLLTLSMLLTVQRSRLTDNDSFWETRNVRSCGNLSLIKFWCCCVHSRVSLSQKGWFGEESKNTFWGKSLPSWVRPRRRTKRCARHTEQDTGKCKVFTRVEG